MAGVAQWSDGGHGWGKGVTVGHGESGDGGTRGERAVLWMARSVGGWGSSGGRGGG